MDHGVDAFDLHICNRDCLASNVKFFHNATKCSVISCLSCTSSLDQHGLTDNTTHACVIALLNQGLF